MRSRFLRALLVCAAIGGLLIQRADTVRAVSSGVVISQVYGGGGATTGSPTFKNDYIELFNRGNAPVSLAGMSVQYASSTGNFTQATALPNVTLQPGQYFLVQEGTAAGALGGTLPTPDASGTISMSATTGKVALVNGTAALGTTGCPPSGAVVDLLGYGTGVNCAEGTPTAALTNTAAAIRAVHGCTDTDANSSDFAIGTPAPRNTATTLAPCDGGDTAPSVSSTTPANSATNVPVNSTIVINFSESVTASASAFSLECPAGSPRTFTQTASPATTFTLTPSSPLPAGTACAVKVTATEVTDNDPTDPPDTMASDYTFSFTTASAADTAPAVTGASPANGAPNVPVNSSIVIIFNESVTASSSAFSIQCPAGVQQFFAQTASPATTYTLTPSSSLPYSTTCTVSVTADQISDADTNDPPDGLTSDATFSFTTAAAPPPGAGTVMINELDADTPGSDSAEFVELYDGGTGNTPLDGLVVVFFEGASRLRASSRYAAFDLDGYSTDAQGYFVMGNPGVPGASLTFEPGEFGLLSNGPDAVGLYIGSGSDFPNGTIATTTNLQDAIVYGTDDPNASGLLPLLNAGQTIVNENATGNSQTQSSQRCPDGMGGFRNTSTVLSGRADARHRQHLPGGAAAERRRDQPDLRRRRQRRRHLSQRLRRAVQPRHQRCGPHRMVAAVRLVHGKRLGFQQAAAGRRDRSRRVLPDCTGVGRRERRGPAAGEHHRSDQHGGCKRKDRARQQLYGAGGQLSDLRPEHQGPRRLWQRRLRRRIDHDGGGQQYDGALPQEQWEPRHRQQRERLRRAGDAESAPHGRHRRARPERADHRPARERFQRAARRHDPGDLHGASRRG